MTITTVISVPGIDLLDILPNIGAYVVDAIIDEPDGTEIAGDSYLVAALGRGEFAGFSDNIAILTLTRGWIFIPPNGGITVYVLDLAERLTYDGSWVVLPPSSGAIRTITSSGSVNSTDVTILANCAGGAIVETLPNAAANADRILNFKKIDSSANTLSFVGTVDGSTSYTIIFQNQSITIQSNGTQWYVL